MTTGRPTAAETQARTREFVRLVFAGEPWDVAAVAARVKPMRALRILHELEGAGVVTVGRVRAA